MRRNGEASPGSLPVLDRAGRRTINSPSPGMGSRSVARRIRELALAVLLPSVVVLACQPSAHRDRSRSAKEAPESDAPYQAEVEEGLGAAVAILVDTSGSMKQDAPGDSRPKYVVAQEALEAMLDATDAFVAKRPDFPIKIGVYSFASSVHVLRPIQPYDRAAVRATLASLPRPGGGTAWELSLCAQPRCRHHRGLALRQHVYVRLGHQMVRHPAASRKVADDAPTDRSGATPPARRCGPHR